MLRHAVFGICLAAGAALSPTAEAVAAPTRDTVVDPALMQIDEPKYLGKPLDGNTVLIDDLGTEFRLGDMLGKPVILLLSYYACDGSCPTMKRGLASALAEVKRFRLGEDYRVLTVSFDKSDTSRTAADFLAMHEGAPAQGWRHAVFKDFAQGEKALIGSVGFRYFWSSADRMFLHSNVLVFLTPEGRVARYLYGSRMEARNIELALIDADWGRISNSTAIFDMLTGACYSYNYAEGRYQPNYSLLAGVGSLLFGIAITGFGIEIYRRKLKREMAVYG